MQTLTDHVRKLDAQRELVTPVFLFSVLQITREWYMRREQGKFSSKVYGVLCLYIIFKVYGRTPLVTLDGGVKLPDLYLQVYKQTTLSKLYVDSVKEYERAGKELLIYCSPETTLPSVQDLNV